MCLSTPSDSGLNSAQRGCSLTANSEKESKYSIHPNRVSCPICTLARTEGGHHAAAPRREQEDANGAPSRHRPNARLCNQGVPCSEGRSMHEGSESQIQTPGLAQTLRLPLGSALQV